jgi:DNA-binding HxlR family transcriptional regulator
VSRSPEATRASSVDAGPPVRVAYELTDKGLAFGKVAEAIERWGRQLGGRARA